MDDYRYIVYELINDEYYFVKYISLVEFMSFESGNKNLFADFYAPGFWLYNKLKLL